MVPLLSFLLSSGSKKKEPRYTIHFSQKSRPTNPLQVPQKDPYRVGGPLTGHFAYLLKTSSFGFPSKGALPKAPSTEFLERERELPYPQSPFIQLSKSPVDELSSRFPKQTPYEKRCPSPEWSKSVGHFCNCSIAFFFFFGH